MQPQPFGLYTLINRINVGGMAEVFKACYYDQGRPAFAAIKRILPHLAQDMSFINMFITEAHTAGRLVHPNIAQIIEQGEEEGEYFISMEYVSGRDLLYLRHHLRERGMYFPPALAAYVIQGVASALDYAHRLCDAQGQHLEIIHRDVSPQNILISYDGGVKLIDFGIAKAKVRTQEHTRAGVLKGKFGYMAPEQVKGQGIDHRIDIFALGTVFYELLTNQRLFMGESDIETLELVRNAQVTPPSQLNEWVPPLLDHIVMQALQADPADRFQSAGEFAQALQYFIHNEAPMTHQATLKSWMAKEFSTFIAHEKAQDSYLIEQMVANLEDSAEDLDSTSLISSDVIDQLNQYTAEQLGTEGQGHQTDEMPQNEWADDWHTSPLSQDSLPSPDADTSPPGHAHISSQDTPVKDGASQEAPEIRPSNMTIPVSPEVVRQIEEAHAVPTHAMAHNQYPTEPQPIGGHPTAQHSAIDNPYPFVDTPRPRPNQVEDEVLEELLEEPFDEDSLGDESALYTKQPNLDELLSVSLSQGGASPLAAQSSLRSPLSVSAGQLSPLASQNTSHNPQQKPLPEPITPPIFSDYEPTPIPSMRRGSAPRRSGRPLMKALIGVTLLGSLIGGALLLQSLFPSARDLNLTVIPMGDQATVQVGLEPPVALAQKNTFSLSSGETIRVSHPQFTPWTYELTEDDLARGQLEVNLEKNAPQMMLKVDSNRVGAQVWVLGRVRGVTPFHARVPVSIQAKQRGRLNIKVTHDSAPPVNKDVKMRGGEFRTWVRFK